MLPIDGHDVGTALDFLLNSERRQSDRLLDRTLLAFPSAFGSELAEPLAQARACVLRRGDDRSRELLMRPRPRDLDEADIARVRRILARRPGASERASPALLRVRKGIEVALAHPIPEGGARLAVRMQSRLHPEVVHASATRIEPSDATLARWEQLGHRSPPHSVWFFDPPSWCLGNDDLAIEVVPNPSGFNEAMLIAHRGAGRVLVTEPESIGDACPETWRRAAVMPSGWSYLCADRTMGSSLPLLPSGAPHPSTAVCVPDEDLFALCAARTWTASLRDSISLRYRNDFRLLGGNTHASTQGTQGETA